MSPLAIKISNWIKEQVNKAGAKGIVLGISGGLDSAVVATLSKIALGKNVLGLIMPCRSNPEDQRYADLLTKKINIKTQIIELTPIYDISLKALPPASKMAAANIKARLRMTTLYYFASKLNYLVAGTGNKSELTIGYFTKYGDGGVDILPIGNLLKTEVRNLAKQIGVPDELIKRPPSAGLWEGQTDEGEMGITYEELDKTITAIEKNDINNCNPKTLKKVKELISKSAHKKHLPLAFRT